MNTTSISNQNLLRILDERTHKAYYGCDQEWYTTEWQRLSGCGPSVACTIMSYLNHGRPSSGSEQKFKSKKDCLLLMEDIWKYVTPTKEGIPTTKMFYEAMLAYTKYKGLNVEYRFCDVPEDKSIRPGLPEVLGFLEAALLLGVDLKLIGILYMAALLALTLPPASRWAASVRHLRTMLLSGALGGEILLVRFQVVQDTYCPFCLAFGLCILVLFAANFTKMNKYLALGAFLTGIVAFALFFEGSVLPLYR